MVVFALLDAFYLALERAYRDLYKRAVADPPQAKEWTLEAGKVGPAKVIKGLTGFAVWPLYVAALGGAIAVALTT